MEALASALLAFTAGLVLVPAVRALARRVGMVAAPRKDRWHSAPTALLGGVGIFTAFAIGLAVFPRAADDALPVLLASGLMFVVGLVDDVVQMRPLLKLGLQVVAALIVVGSGIHLPWTHDAFVDGAITLVWLVGITNAVNLLDNMDGLAAGIAAIASVFLSVTFVLNGQSELAVLPALLCGAAAGFLVYNFKPASIFMGDGGSMFLGSLLGGLALLSSYGRSRSVASVMLTPVLIMMIPILDTTLVTITRRLRGQPVSVGGRDHTSHRLVALGASERRAVFILYAVAAASGVVALGTRWLRTDALMVLVPAFGLVVCLFGSYLARIPVGDNRLLPSSPRFGFAFGPQLIADVCVCLVAYVAAALVRWDFLVPPDQTLLIVRTLSGVIIGEMFLLWACGLYSIDRQSPSADDLLVLTRAAVVASATTGAAVFAASGFGGISRGALFLNCAMLLIGLTGVRLATTAFSAMIAGKTESGQAGHLSADLPDGSSGSVSEANA